MVINVNLVYNKKAGDTINRMIDIARNSLGIIFHKVLSDDGRYTINNNYPVLRYGVGDGFNLSKSEQCELFVDIIPNTITNRDNLQPYDVVVVKNPTRIMLHKDVKSGLTEYKYISNKSEWRVNYSYGVVNSVYNKNLESNTIFGKADITQWSYETDKTVRKYLIDTTKSIALLLSTNYPLLKHFGIDIIRDNDTGTYYFLELNKAHSLNDENIMFFLKGFCRENNITIPTTNNTTNNNNNSINNNYLSIPLSIQELELLNSLTRRLLNNRQDI